MASVENGQRDACFGNLFRRLKHPRADTQTKRAKSLSSDASNSDSTQDMLVSDASNLLASTPPYNRKKQRSSCQHQNDFDFYSHTSGWSRPGLLSLCFGFRISRCRFKKKLHVGSRARKTTLKTSVRDESVTDMPDSNETARSAAIDSNSPSGGIDRLQQIFPSRTSSFYSAVSCRSNAEGGWKRLGHETRLRSSASMDVNLTGNEDFFSVDGDYFDYETTNETAIGTNHSVVLSNDSTIAPSSLTALCCCGFGFHNSVYNPEFPLITGPGICPDSHEECVALANAYKGCWETIVDRSDSLDPQYRCLGLGLVKRAVMNRMAVPLTMFLEENDTIFHCWIHTPLGIRHMRSNLHHQQSIDDDPDAGRWTGVTHVVDFSISWFCNGNPVRALQQKRQNPSVGTSIETRCVLPDRAERKIMLFQFVMIPNGKTENEKLQADRILRYTGAKKI